MSVRSIVAALLLLGVPATLVARDIYVDNVTGDDRRDGSAPVSAGDQAGPCRTIRRALQLARNGDRIVLANTGEPYRESITLQAARHSGIANRPFQLDGSGAMLDGTEPVPRDRWEYVHDDIYRFRPSRMSFQILYLDGRPARRHPVIQRDQLPALKPLEWCLFEGHIYFRVEPGKMPRQYDLSHTALPVGITLYEVRHVIIRDLVVQGFQLDGINAHDGVTDTRLEGLTCRGNGRSGISIGGASQVTITACLVGDNGAAQVRTEGFSHTSIANCDLIENTAPAVVREGGLITMISRDAPAE